MADFFISSSAHGHSVPPRLPCSPSMVSSNPWCPCLRIILQEPAGCGFVWNFLFLRGTAPEPRRQRVVEFVRAGIQRGMIDFYLRWWAGHHCIFVGFTKMYAGAKPRLVGGATAQAIGLCPLLDCMFILFAHQRPCVSSPASFLRGLWASTTNTAWLFLRSRMLRCFFICRWRCFFLELCPAFLLMCHVHPSCAPSNAGSHLAAQ